MPGAIYAFTENNQVQEYITDCDPDAKVGISIELEKLTQKNDRIYNIKFKQGALENGQFEDILVDRLNLGLLAISIGLLSYVIRGILSSLWILPVQHVLNVT